MREILFRGKNIDLEWVEGDLLQNGVDYKTAIRTNKEGLVERVISHTVGQYTGLTDKNGKKIFEGDILVISNQRNYPVLVKFTDFGWCCVIPNNNTYLNYRHRLENNYTKYEVIGNIHDNPELLNL